MSQNNQTDGHILVVACPFQGHAAPLMKISHYITKFGTHKVTFLTTTCARLGDSSGKFNEHGVRIVSIPDGIDPESKDQKKLHESVQKVMPDYVKNLLEKSSQSSKSDDIGDRISGVIVDSPLAFMLDVPKKMGVKIAVFWGSTPGCLALGVKIPNLIESGFFDNDGTPLKNEKIQVLADLPPMPTSDLIWYFPNDTDTQKSIYHVTKSTVDNTIKHADWILCNWFHDLYPTSQNLLPNILSIGPLLANGQSAGSFCSEDSTCLTWLDKQDKSSVIYVAFGSTSKFSLEQLDELAFGLELTGRPFLWVAWSGLKNDSSSSDSNNNYHTSKEFVERVADRGKMVEWAPQEAVLAHPSISCFITHCGWSSFMEGLSHGVPLICWPYFGDQLYTRTCICDHWKVGLRLKSDESSGVVSRDEIKKTVEELHSDCGVRENALKLKEMAGASISKGGSSLVNLESMMGQMKF